MSAAAERAWIGDRELIDVTPFPAADRARVASPILRRLLVAGDATALIVAWCVAVTLAPPSGIVASGAVARVVALTIAGVWILRTQQLYLSRVASMRTVELARLTRAVLMLAAAHVVLERFVHGDVRGETTVIGVGLSLVSLVIARTTFRGWLKAQRTQGRFCRPVILVGIDDQTRELHALLDIHPDLGFSVVGVVGDRGAAVRHGMLDLWLGHLDEAPRLVASGTGAGAIVLATALDPHELNDVVRALLDGGAHVHLSPGVRGIDHRRLRAVHMAYEPMFYIEPSGLTHAQLVLKRTLDLSISTIALALTAPVLIVAAVAIKIADRGPIFFRQQRVGRDGTLFTVFKLRTMAVGAEEMLDDLLARNERSGPLFKMHADPRVTFVGRFLRDTSIDELPQLLNVILGDMSLVGPRPALPAEVAVFHDRLRERDRVLPGITGLWQVECRDNPSFDAYERLDLFYVENWSIALDLMILLSTVEAELARMIKGALGRRSSDETVVIPTRDIVIDPTPID